MAEVFHSDPCDVVDSTQDGSEGSCNVPDSGTAHHQDADNIHCRMHCRHDNAIVYQVEPQW